jgi:large subunit ribosomal protein L28
MFPSRVLWDAISQPFKQAQTGLFQGKMKQYGNNVPFSYKKTRRTWLPNVHSKRLPSTITEGMVRVKLTTRALRTIKKVLSFIVPLEPNLSTLGNRKVVWTII